MPSGAKNHFLLQLDAADSAAIAGFSTTRDIKVGEVLYEVGERVDTVFFMESGAISVIRMMSDGRGVETRTIGRESAFGLMHAGGSRESLSRVIVQLAGHAILAPVDGLAELMDASSSLRRSLIRHAQLTFAQAEQSVACNVLHSVEQRLARWLLMSQDRTEVQPLNLTHEFIALMLGVQRTSVTVAARHMQRRRVIDYSRGRVSILDRPALERASCECYEAFRRDAARLMAEA